MSDKTTLSNAAYDKLKATAQVILPAVGAAYFSLAQIWGLPSPEEVVGTITIIDTFLGVVLTVMAKNYVTSGAAFDGEVVVEEVMHEGEKKTVFGLQFDNEPSPEELAQKDSIAFKVVKPQSEFWDGPQ